MGMTIDDAINYYSNKNVVLTEEEAEANTIALNTMRKYHKLQADYENRLKADFVAMLEELKTEIERIPNSYEHKPIGTYDYCLGAEHERKANLELIQQKINALKGGE